MPTFLGKTCLTDICMTNFACAAFVAIDCCCGAQSRRQNQRRALRESSELRRDLFATSSSSNDFEAVPMLQERIL